MYLFARSARLGPGNVRDSMVWSANITEKVNQISELDVSLWTTVFSPGLGTLVWTAAVEHLSVLEATDAKLAADDVYISLVEEGAKYLSADPIDDVLLQLVFADEDAANSQPQYASVVASALAPGNSTRGIELGVEIAQRAKRITGRPTSFGVASTGPYGGVEWISLYDSVDQLQKAEADIAADAGFTQFVDKEASTAYNAALPTIQTIYRRIV
ncbi:MAG: hypothetical protein QOC92_4867 [Acidimicrobiaceae bacterium]